MTTTRRRKRAAQLTQISASLGGGEQDTINSDHAHKVAASAAAAAALDNESELWLRKITFSTADTKSWFSATLAIQGTSFQVE